MTAHIGGRLTVAKVKTAGPGKHSDGANLWLQVGTNGSRSWYLRFTLSGRSREMGLGPYPLVGLSEARDKSDGAAPASPRRDRPDRSPQGKAAGARSRHLRGCRQAV